MDPESKTPLPDVAGLTPHQDWGTALSWVGMSAIELPVKWQGMTLQALVDFQVNLCERNSRGIHMSRLYRLLADELAGQELSLSLLAKLTKMALETHQDLSDQSRLKVAVQMPVQRASLVSGLKGWRSYPVSLTVEETKLGRHYFVDFSVIYSSTCPASTALAEQIRSDELGRFRATPHSQRSRAEVCVEVLEFASVSPIDLIDQVEAALGTPVQTAVRREDEQQFAILNAENLMFCEDAARKIHRALLAIRGVIGFHGQVTHFESLHPHNAVACFSRT